MGAVSRHPVGLGTESWTLLIYSAKEVHMQGTATLPTLYNNFQNSFVPMGRDPHTLPHPWPLLEKAMVI